MMQSEKRPRMCNNPYLVRSAIPFRNAFGDVEDSFKHTAKMMKLEDSPPRPSPPSTPPLMTKRQKSLKRTIPRPPQLQRVVRTAPPLFSRTATRMKVLRDPIPAIISFKSSNEAPKLSPLYDKTLRDDLNYIDQCFELHKTIGSGSFSRVVRARSKDDLQYYAIKCKKNPFGSLSNRLCEIEEVRKHELLPEHPNIINFVRAWEEEGLLYIQMELCERSLNVICNEEHELPEPRVWSYFIDVLMAVNHLHLNNLIHLDIKPDNILVTSQEVCKLGDFGLVFDEVHDDARLVTEGDCKYLAKELLSDGKPTKKADIFSLGITLLEIATDMDLPLRGRYWAELRRGEIRQEFLNDISCGLKDVISAMIRPEPRRRPSAVDILEHRYIKEHMNRRQLQTYAQYRSGKKGFGLAGILSRFL